LGSPGIGNDEILRDPWGQPYIITLDLQGNNSVFDPYLNEMNQASVVKNGPRPSPVPGPLLTPGSAVVWSLGPNKQIDVTLNIKAPINKYIVKSFD
jgi:hypothetical protein